MVGKRMDVGRAYIASAYIMYVVTVIATLAVMLVGIENHPDTCSRVCWMIVCIGGGIVVGYVLRFLHMVVWLTLAFICNHYDINMNFDTEDEDEPYEQ